MEKTLVVESDDSGGVCECSAQRSGELCEGGGRECLMARNSERCRRTLGPRMKVLLEDRNHYSEDCKLSLLEGDCKSLEDCM